MKTCFCFRFFIFNEEIDQGKSFEMIDKRMKKSKNETEIFKGGTRTCKNYQKESQSRFI